MKLTAAKCPNCNADIEVNETLDKAICQYCGSTILIESAIKKYQMEISGTIKVDGIQSYSEKIEIIQKHLKIGNIDEAINILDELLEINPFDEQALSIYIQTKTAIQNHINEEYSKKNVISSISWTKKLSEAIDENNADEYIYKIEKTASGTYTDIIEKYNHAMKICNANLKKERIKNIFISIIIFGIFFYFMYKMTSI